MRLLAPIAAPALAAIAASFVFAIRAGENSKVAAFESDRASETARKLMELQRAEADLQESAQNLNARISRARESRDRAKSKLAAVQAQLRASVEEQENLARSLRVLRGESTQRAGGTGSDAGNSESNTALSKSYRDMADMEKQLVDVCRAKNEVEQQLACLRERGDSKARRIAALENQLREAGLEPVPKDPELTWQPGDLQIEPKIDGVVLGMSDKVNLILISVGDKDNLQVGYKFTVYRGNTYISKLVVEKVEDGWAACTELTDYQKEAIQQGDSVSTRVFE